MPTKYLTSPEQFFYIESNFEVMHGSNTRNYIKGY